MIKLTLTIVLAIFVHFSAFAQGCLPQGINFNTQEMIDNFQTNYPNCTEIEGNVKISGDYIVDLNGLNVLTSIGGYLDIRGNDALISMAGLENLDSIGGYLGFGASPTSGSGNISLASLSGLANLTTVGEGLYFYYNPSLTNLSGLENLISVGGLFRIETNNNLTSLTGLENLASIGGNIEIWDNNALSNLTGLENLVSIEGNIEIWGNDALSSLTGIDNIEAGSINDLEIAGNFSLSTCDVQSLCDYLVSPHGVVKIHRNAIGCNNPWEIAYACEHVLPCLPYGNYYFTNQTDIDNFGDYCDCTEIVGNVEIDDYNSNILDLNGLNVLTSIEGDLIIAGNSLLSNLTGLENLTSIGGDVEIGYMFIWGSTGNPALTSLVGLDNLNSIGGFLHIVGNDNLTSLSGLENLSSIEGDLCIGFGFNGWDSGGNESLASLSGLENVVSLGGILSIADNDTLVSLSGLNNIDAGSITDLSIFSNNSLANCEVNSICDYLLSPNGNVIIENNAPGCYSIEEVEEACESVGKKDYILQSLTIHPNPSDNGIISITIANSKDNLHLCCFNTYGQQEHQQTIQSEETVINVSNWQPGIYLVVVYANGKPVGSAKFVAQ